MPSRVASSRWSAISAASAVSAPARPNSDRTRCQARSTRPISGLPVADDEPDRAGEPLPALQLAGQLLLPGGGQRVELGLAPGLGDAALRPEPALLFQAMQRRVERALSHEQRVLAHLLNPLG